MVFCGFGLDWFNLLFFYWIDLVLNTPKWSGELHQGLSCNWFTCREGKKNKGYKPFHWYVSPLTYLNACMRRFIFVLGLSTHYTPLNQIKFAYKKNTKYYFLNFLLQILMVLALFILIYAICSSIWIIFIITCVWCYSWRRAINGLLLEFITTISILVPHMGWSNCFELKLNHEDLNMCKLKLQLATKNRQWLFVFLIIHLSLLPLNAHEARLNEPYSAFILRIQLAWVKLYFQTHEKREIK